MSRKLWLVMLLCLSAIAGAQTTSGPEYRGMWVSRFEWPRSSQSATESNIDTIIANVRAANFNSVFFQVRGAMETLYPSPNEPWGSQLGSNNPGYDPMQYAINKAHTAGVEFHAYINTHCVYQTNASNTPPPHSPPGIAEHPFYLHGNPADPGHDDWCFVDSTGTTQALGAGEDRYVWTSPGVPSFQTWTREQVLYVANNYDVDGVHFDRIRVAGDGSHDPISVARQASPITNPAGLSYQNWNRDQITRFLNDTYGAIAEVNANRPEGKRHIKVSSAPFGLVSSQLGVNQDLNAWTKIGAQDFFCPQIYTSSVSTFSSRLTGNLANVNGRYLVAGMSRNTAGSTPIIHQEVTDARTQGTSGSLVFSYTGFSSAELATYPTNVFGTFVNPPDMPWISAPTDCIIVGNITDNLGNEIVDAQLTRTDGNGYVWLSGYDGFYSMLKVPAGQPLEIQANKAGFPIKTVPVSARTAGSVTRINIVLSNSQGQVSLDKTTYQPTQAVNVSVTDADIAGFGSVDVTMVSDTEFDGEIVTLSEIGATGTFMGSIQLDSNSPSPADGMLQVSDNDNITATYIDDDDGTGESQIRTDSATVDGSAPVISDISISNIGGNGATITFTTDEPTTALIQIGTACGSLTGSFATNVVGTNHSANVTGLSPLTQYYFNVTAQDLAVNSATDDNSGECHTFTTTVAVAPAFFTELFNGTSSNFDLSNLTLTLTPDGSPNYYRGCLDTATGFLTDPAGGTDVSLSDDSSVQVPLTGGQTFPFFGIAYSSLYVVSNGYVTLGQSDTDYSESLTEHFALKRIAAVFDDLDPEDGGNISTKQLSDRIAVTYENVPEYGTTNTNSFQFELFFDGTIRITWLGVSVLDGLAGISAGTGTPSGFVMSDLSALAGCGNPQVTPIAAFVSSGAAGGTFAPACNPYTISNATGSAFDYTVESSQLWITPDINGGTLQPGETAVVTLCVDDIEASTLGNGNYTADIIFTDTTNAQSVSRAAILNVIPPPDQAFNPDPPNGATELDVDYGFAWEGGANTDSFDFYFGTSNPPDFVGNAPSDITDAYMGTLDFETTYYWRVDARNAGGVTEGEVWTFSTQSFPDVDVTPASITVYADPGATTATTFQVANSAPFGAGDLIFSTSHSDDLGGSVVTDEVGTFGNIVTSTTAYAGNAYQVTNSTVLTTIEPFMYLTLDTTLDYVVFEATSQSGPYNRIFTQTQFQTANTTAFEYYPLSNLNIPLVAGRFYIIAVGWNAFGAYPVFVTPASPQNVSFGQQFSGFTTATYPVGTSVGFNYNETTFYQRLTTNSSWISLIQPESQVTAGSSTNCQLIANAAALGLGTYTGNVTITSNDPDELETIVPVTLIVKDISPPAVPPQPDMTDVTDTGASNSDNITALAQPDFVGTAEEGSMLTIYLDGAPVGNMKTDNSGSWAYTPSFPVPDGSHSIRVSAADAEGNMSVLSEALVFVIDATTPDPPSAPQLTLDSDSGYSNIDGITNISAPAFTGTAESNLPVELKLGPVVMGSVTSDGDGLWTITPDVPLLDSTYSFTATVTDVAGNVSPPSAAMNVTIDTVVPTLSMARIGTPVDSIQLQFNESVLNVSTANFVLTRDGSPQALDSTMLTGGGAGYLLSNLAPITGIGGSFQFTVSGIADAAGNIMAATNDAWTGSTFSDLIITMTTTPPIAAMVGETITYVISVQNDGPADAPNVVLLDQVTTNALFTTATLSQGSLTELDGLLTMNLGAIPANSSALITLRYVATEIGTILNTAAVGPTASDTDTANNGASSSVNVLLGPGPDLLGSGLLLGSSCKPDPIGVKCTHKLRLFLRNRGNFDSGKTAITYYLSFDQELDDADVLLTSKKLGKVKAVKQVTRNVSLKPALTGNPSGQFLIVRLDPGNMVAEASEFNNEFVIGPLP